MTKEERSRWRAAIALSLCTHIAVFAALSLMPQRVSEKEPVMSVRLVTLSGPRGTGGGGGGTGGEQKQAAPVKAAPQPKKSAAKPKAQKPKPVKTARAEKPKETPKPAPEPVKAEAQEETAAENGAEETIAPYGAGEGTAEGISAGEGGGSGGGIGTGQGEGTGPGIGDGYGIADVGDLEVLKKVTPEYPLFSRKRREEGTAVVIARVENGSVTSAELESSSGHNRLDGSALRAVMGWKFNSTGVIRVRIPFAFRIRG